MAARSKALVCGRSLTDIVGSKPAGGKDECFVCVVCSQVVCAGLITRPEKSNRVWCVRGDVPKGQVICIYISFHGEKFNKICLG